MQSNDKLRVAALIDAAQASAAHSDFVSRMEASLRDIHEIVHSLHFVESAIDPVLGSPRMEFDREKVSACLRVLGAALEVRLGIANSVLKGHFRVSSH